MKKILFIITVILIIISGIQVNAQDVQANIDKARSSYKSGDLENTRFALQQALNSINQEIAREILALLPAEMNNMSMVEGGDDVSGTSYGYAGLYVNRSYALDTTASSSIEIVSDSPYLAGINALLTMPAFAYSDPNQKQIKIKNYKAMLTKSMDDQGIASYDIQLPFSSSLLTFHCTGIQDENEVVGMVNTIPVDKIVKLTQ
jgi:hypothetical protein